MPNVIRRVIPVAKNIPDNPRGLARIIDKIIFKIAAIKGIKLLLTNNPIVVR